MVANAEQSRKANLVGSSVVIHRCFLMRSMDTLQAPLPAVCSSQSSTAHRALVLAFGALRSRLLREWNTPELCLAVLPSCLLPSEGVLEGCWKA